MVEVVTSIQTVVLKDSNDTIDQENKTMMNEIHTTSGDNDATLSQSVEQSDVNKQDPRSRRLSWMDLKVKPSPLVICENMPVNDNTIDCKFPVRSQSAVDPFSVCSSDRSLGHDTLQSVTGDSNTTNSPSRESIIKRKSLLSTQSRQSSGDTGASRLRNSAVTNPLSTIQDNDEIDDIITEKKKTHVICWLKSLTIITLLAATVIAAVLSYVIILNSEVQVFEKQYNAAVEKLKETIQHDFRIKLDAAEAFSNMYTSRYGPQDTWPNVTMPNFAEQAKGLLGVSEGIALSFNPIITNETRAGWEAHALESAHLLGNNNHLERFCFNDVCNRIVADGIYRKVDGEVVDDPGYSPGSLYPYHLVPVWQIYPSDDNWRAVMFNLHSELYRQRALDDMIQYQVPTITGLLHLVQHDVMDPSSILFYPVFNNFDPYFRSLVGSISIVFTWADILRSSLPDYIKGLIVVLEKSVTNIENQQTYTYSVSGNVVTLLGDGDYHDTTFDNQKIEVFTNVAAEAENLGIVHNLVTYKLRIYPSKEFKSQYVTQKPLAMTLVVVFIFILTSGIFLLYDYLVGSRQNSLMKFAKQSGRIVNSFFPSSVRDRVFNVEQETLTGQTLCDVEGASDNLEDTTTTNNQKRHSKLMMRKSIQSFLKGSFLKNESIERIDDENDQHEYIQNSPPIADLFHNTTIMFADIVSFTEWSSNHTPEDVFYLLETLFLEFDKAAKRRGVFKLGTIGDCYVAVTGVPEAREDHAVVMAEFANECRSKTNSVLEALKSEFGSSIENLSMRFGLHSGSVTAGVLRGWKSRFELFGDTINTASRMESTGAPDKIQISKETAEALSIYGKDSWFVPRIDLVHAKGKGFLQTYWLDIYRKDEKITERNPATYMKTKHQPSFSHQMYSLSQSSNDNSSKDINGDEEAMIKR